MYFKNWSVEPNYESSIYLANGTNYIFCSAYPPIFDSKIDWYMNLTYALIFKDNLWLRVLRNIFQHTETLREHLPQHVLAQFGRNTGK